MRISIARTAASPAKRNAITIVTVVREIVTTTNVGDQVVSRARQKGISASTIVIAALMTVTMISAEAGVAITPQG